ncbi:MAG: TerB family tellurite resistance protein [Bacteroidota bacterium]
MIEKNKSHIKNLIALAMADGKMSQEEEHVLFATAHRLGMSGEELEAIKAHPDSIEFKTPQSYGDKIEQIYDFISLISVDGDIDEQEVKLCRSLALKFDLAPRIIDDLLEKFFGEKGD